MGPKQSKKKKEKEKEKKRIPIQKIKKKIVQKINKIKRDYYSIQSVSLTHITAC